MVGRAGRDQRNRARRSMSPESSRTLQTPATCAGAKASIGKFCRGRPNMSLVFFGIQVL